MDDPVLGMRKLLEELVAAGEIEDPELLERATTLIDQHKAVTPDIVGLDGSRYF